LMYLIFRCAGCGRHLYAEEGAATRTCPCGKRIVLDKVKVISKAEDEREAGDLVRALQMGGREMTGFSPAG
jgi:DNA-directed RNA polymerase subunit RPC12/RpoP